MDADATEPSISILGSTAGATITQPQAIAGQQKPLLHPMMRLRFHFRGYVTPLVMLHHHQLLLFRLVTQLLLIEPPTLTKLDVKAINSTDSAYVRNGDVVIITVKTDEVIQAPTVTTSHGLHLP